MRIFSFFLIAAAVILALPFGWGLGVVFAYAIAGKDFGQLPVGTVPIAIVASIVHYGECTIPDLKRYLRAGGVEIREAIHLDFRDQG